MQSIDFKIAVGAALSLQYEGTGIFLESGTSTTTDLYIFVQPEHGGEIKMKPGQWVRFPEKSRSFQVRCNDVAAAFTGRVVIGSGDFGDNNTLNKVVLDGAFANTVTVNNTIAQPIPVAIQNGQVEIINDVGNPLPVSVSGVQTVQENLVAITNSYAANTAVTSVAIQILAPASNVNGVTIQSATMLGSVNKCAFIAKSSAPADYMDGTVIMLNSDDKTDMPNKIKVPAGRGLYIIADASGYGAPRFMNFTVH